MFPMGWPQTMTAQCYQGSAISSQRDHFVDNLWARTCWSKRDFPQSPSLTPHFRGVRLTSDLKSLAVRACLVSSLSFIGINHKKSLALLIASWHVLPGRHNNTESEHNLRKSRWKKILIFSHCIQTHVCITLFPTTTTTKKLCWIFSFCNTRCSTLFTLLC